MNKKLKSLILSGVLAVSVISTPTFATNNGEQGPTVTTQIAEVPKEEPLSEEEAPGDDEPSDDEIPETDASEEDETDDSETTPTESETPTDETVPPDTTEPVEKVEEAVQYIGKLDISNMFDKIDTNNNYLGEFAISSINGITIKYENGNSYTLSDEEFTYTNLNGWITINLEKHSIELGSETCIIIEYTDDEGNLYKTEVPTSQLQSVEIYNEEKGYHLVASEMLSAIVEDEKETVDEPAEDEEPEEPQIEGDLDDKGPDLYSTTVPIGDANKNLEIGDKKLFKNAYTGKFWVNGSYNGETKDGIIQRRYVDHIDIRVSDATIKIKHLVNGEFQNSETVTGANVVSVQRVLINDKDLKYHSTKTRYEENPQFGTAGLEFNFQIAKLDTFTYSEWLDLTTVNKISFVCTLEGYLNGKKQTFENVTITINGIDDIVGKSYCSNASGLDYYVSGEVSDDIIIEIPFVPEEIDINLTPGTGDISVYGDLYYPVFALAILVATNKKNNKN